jgi:hypothetical protein
VFKGTFVAVSLEMVQLSIAVSRYHGVWAKPGNSLNASTVAIQGTLQY